MIDPAIHADPDEQARQFRLWQWRILIGALAGYTFYYFVRRNFSVALPAMEKDLGISKTDLGTFITLHGLLYGPARALRGALARKRRRPPRPGSACRPRPRTATAVRRPSPAIRATSGLA